LESKKIHAEDDETLEYSVFHPERALAMLRSFKEEAKQVEDERALAELMQALDEDRPEGQKIFSEYRSPDSSVREMR
jgi:hypothetical protein